MDSSEILYGLNAIVIEDKGLKGGKADMMNIIDYCFAMVGVYVSGWLRINNY